jgi:16S rRNA C967 or C1407 C5-methylase (RsmB/RsmF family)
MNLPFRNTHIIQIFNEYENQNKPLDNFLNRYYRDNKSIGSKDRKYISDRCYAIIRWRALLDYLSKKSFSWENRINIYESIKEKLETYVFDKTIPCHVRLSFPKNYYNKLCGDYPEEEVEKFCLTSNSQAPTTIRVNTLKTSRSFLLNKWQDIYSVSEGKECDTSIIFNKKINFLALEEFKNGLFEIQDEGSQLICNHIQVRPGDNILDYCSGSGGKTLALAPKLKGKGQLYLHDIRSSVLLKSKIRLKRAGISNVQFLFSRNGMKKLERKMDWIILDVPCSGSGTLRRNPDMKWKFNPDKFSALLETQKNIFHKSYSFLKKTGYIIYITCSIFHDENEKQVDYFLKNYHIELKEPIHSWFPKKEGKDGFFCAIFKKKSIL